MFKNVEDATARDHKENDHEDLAEHEKYMAGDSICADDLTTIIKKNHFSISKNIFMIDVGSLISPDHEDYCNE